MGLGECRESILGPEEQVAFREAINLPSTTYGAFGLYRYPAKFIPHVIAYVLERYASPGMTVFDPFAGYGTVGVVCRLYGHDYELWDLNPLLETLHEITQLDSRTIDVGTILQRMRNSSAEFTPDWSNFEYWFAKDFIPMLKQAWGFYHSLEDNNLRLLLTIPLLKVSRYFSYDDMGRMKLSKSPRSIERVETLLQLDWKSEFYRMLKSEIDLIRMRLREYQLLGPKSTRYVVKGGVDSLTLNLTEAHDILVTSPPYLQSQEYIRQAKMDLFWLGYSQSEIRRLGRLEVPYRKVPALDVHSETFHRIRDAIQEDRIRNIYDSYFHGIVGAFNRLQENITSYLLLFVGRSSLRGRSIPIDRILAEHFVEMGWTHEVTLVDTIVARRMFSYRVNPATKKSDSRTLTENLVVLRRT